MDFHPIGNLPRDAEGDLLAAFILCGGDRLMGEDEMMRVAATLSLADEKNAKRLSGVLVRGEDMPPDLAAWVRQNRD